MAFEALTTPWGFPCFVRFPCVHAAANTPAQRLNVSLRSFHPDVSVLPDRVVGSTCALSFSRIARRSLALRPVHSRRHQFVTRLIEGFSHFVTSTTAPIASGWSDCWVGFAPTGKRRFCTAHTHVDMLLRLSRLLRFRTCRLVAPPPLGQIFAMSARLAFSRGLAKSRNARIFNGTSGGPVWTRWTGSGSGPYPRSRLTSRPSRIAPAA